MFCQTTIGEREVGVDQVGCTEVLVDQFGKEQLRFFGDRIAQQTIKFRVKLPVRRGRVDVVEPQPLTHKVSHESNRFRVIEHPFHLLRQDSSVGELPLACEFEKLFIWQALPQEVRQSTGQRKVIQFAGLTAKEQKLWRTEHRPNGSADHLRKFTSFINSWTSQIDKQLKLVGMQRAAKRPGADSCDDIGDAFERRL